MSNNAYDILDKALKGVITDTQEKLKAIAEVSVQVAKNTLVVGTANPNFTQKHGADLEQYIELKEGANKGEYKIVAGENASNEIKYELYYAEYGAGQEKIPSPIYNPYTPKGKANASGFWYYRLLTPMTYIDEDGEVKITNYNYTNTSVPIQYMATARTVATELTKQLKINTRKKLKTSIKRGLTNAFKE